MTVFDLMSTNNMICDIEITVRLAEGPILDQLNMGLYEGIRPPYPTRVPRKPEYAKNVNQHDSALFKDAEYIRKSINARDDGQEYWQSKPNRLPKGWADLEVEDWEVWQAPTAGTKRPRNGLWHGQYLRVTSVQGGTIRECEQKQEDIDQIEFNLEG